MTFIANHLLLSLLAVVLISAFAGFMVAAILAQSKKRMPTQSDIEPGDLTEPASACVTFELRRLGFSVDDWHAQIPMIQITDPSGITFYMLKGSDLESCLLRHKEKLKQFGKSEFAGA